MLHRQINRKVKEVKSFILNVVQDFIEPSVWNAFSASISTDGRENYLILDDDFPDIRDLKAFLNMLTAIERATESYSLIAVSVFKRLELPQDMWDFRHNYKIYMSTNSVFSEYLTLAKEFSIATFLPALAVKLNQLALLCTGANLEKASEFLIEQIINMEQYQQKYLERKRRPHDTEEHREGFFHTLAKNNDSLLRKFYSEKYDAYFLPDTKGKNSQGYYPEKEADNNTLKNIKNLSNGIIGIRTALDDYVAYSEAGALSGVSWLATFVMDLRQAYLYFQAFDYQAIIAEQANPVAELVKIQLIKLYNSFEKLACIADQFEGACCLKEGTLLRYVDLVIQRYNQIASELKIPIDYAPQKRTFYQARMQARERHLLIIESKLSELSKFRRYQDHVLAEIPPVILCDIQKYIIKHHGEICMNRSHLAQYEKYLAAALIPYQPSMIMAVRNELEHLANRAGFTRHYEIMTVFKKQLMYLQKQKFFLQQRLFEAKENFSNNPYDHFTLNEISEDAKKIILSKLQQHLVKLNQEKESLIHQALPNENAEEKSKLGNVSGRLSNQMLSRIREHGLFSLATAQYEQENTFSGLQALLEAIHHETSLSPKSMMLLEEINEIAAKIVLNENAVTISTHTEPHTSPAFHL
jgi:uncharacterized protein (DUF1778 family)